MSIYSAHFSYQLHEKFKINSGHTLVGHIIFPFQQTHKEASEDLIAHTKFLYCLIKYVMPGPKRFGGGW